jgi:hypothetical protein
MKNIETAEGTVREKLKHVDEVEIYVKVSILELLLFRTSFTSAAGQEVKLLPTF